MQLFANYSKTTSPDEMVEVNIELVSFYLIDIDEKKQIMTSYSIINQKWNDSRLSWNSSMYNLTKVSLTLDSIWKPSTIVTNSASGDGYLTTNKDYSYASIYSNGTVVLNSQCISLQTRCYIKIDKYPFDSQKCTIDIASWPFSDQLEIVYLFSNQSSEKNELGYNNSIWDMMSINFSNFDTYCHHSGCSYRVILEFMRKPTYYIMNSIIPCLILNIIILISFFLPFANQMALGKKLTVIF